MIKKSYIILGFIIIIIFLTVGPMIINMLMFKQNMVEVKGTVDVWVASLSTYYGAIIGGVTSGLLTLFGVKLTLKSSTEQVNETIKEQQRLREEELKNNTIKEQLFQLYHPLYSIINANHYKHGAHDFEDLTEAEQLELINLISKNEIYAEKELYIKILEINWAFNEEDGEYTNLNQLYHEIIDLVTDAISLMKDQLKLPNQEL